MFRFLPESPRWLLTQGKFTKAWNVIKKIDGSVVPQFSEEEFQVLYFALVNKPCNTIPEPLYMRNIP